MAVKRKRERKRPQPLVGSGAFGDDPDEKRPMGSAAFGNSDEQDPLRGSLLFGNDPGGNPTGSASMGGSNKSDPLRGALLFGNAPGGSPTGSSAIGNSDKEAPLRGSLLFGNAPDGSGTGALAFGNASAQLQFRGAQAFGATQLVRSKLGKDNIGYDFGGVLLKADEASMAGIRKDPRDRIRTRVLRILERKLDMDVTRLRSGLSEDAVKWGALRDPETTLDRELAEELRRWYRKAPGEVLGIGHVRDLLEDSEHMHTFELWCSWDRSPVTLSVSWGGDTVAYAETKHHKEHTFFEFKDIEGVVLGYADTLVPHKADQTARVRTIDGVTIATMTLDNPVSDAETEEGKLPRLRATIRDAGGEAMFILDETIATAKVFKAALKEAGSEEPIGKLEDRLTDGNIRCSVELDLQFSQVLAWALAALMADLARRRREGRPTPPPEVDPDIPKAAEALGPRRKRGQ